MATGSGERAFSKKVGMCFIVWGTEGWVRRNEMWETFRGGPGDRWPVDERGGVFSRTQGSRARAPGDSGSGQVPASPSPKHHKERSRDHWRSNGTWCGDLKDEDELGTCPGRSGDVCGGWPSIC